MMTAEENKRRAEDTNVNYLKDNICDCTNDKSYVFISYKSDDWETVLHDVVYRLVKDYGLNVYFDGSFDSHNSLWVNQFPKNMDHYRCKGVIAFFDDKYATSYATLMELMHSQTYNANDNEEDGLPIVPVNLGILTKISGEAGQRDTGLGKKCYEDGSKNDNYEKELTTFKEDFEELVDRGILKKSKHMWKKTALKASVCSEIVSELKAYKEINDNYYERGGKLDAIVASIKDACGEEVFGEILEPVIVNPPTESKPVGSLTPKPPVDILTLDVSTTLEEFERICETTDIYSQLVSYRKKKGNAQQTDYLMASLLGGCDKKLRKAANKYLMDAVSSSPSSQFTWQSNARKFVRETERLPQYFKENGEFKGSGELLDYDKIFKELPRTITIGEVLEKYRNNEKGFMTKDNEKIFEVWNYIKEIKLSEGKKDLSELL